MVENSLFECMGTGMIVLFTDFGCEGPYVGQMKAVLATQAPNVPVIDLMHDAPAFNPRAAGYLLAALVDAFPEQTVFLCVVDPGVGHPERRPLIVQADNRWFVGPGNGLFNAIMAQAGTLKLWEIKWLPATLSDSFHGRDLFAPVAAQLVLGRMPEAQPLTLPENAGSGWPADLYEIIYFDHYGNAMTGIRADRLADHHRLQVRGYQFDYARTFSLAGEGRPFWYRNSSGLVELALDSDSLRERLQLQIGERIKLVDAG